MEIIENLLEPTAAITLREFPSVDVIILILCLTYDVLRHLYLHL